MWAAALGGMYREMSKTLGKQSIGKVPVRRAPVKMDAMRSQALKGKRSRTRQRILDATYRLIGSEHGLSVRIEEVCAAAKISRGTFYNYFVSLDALLQETALELSHEFNLGVLAAIEHMDSFAGRASAAMRYYLERGRADPKWGWAMVNISATGPLFGAETFATALETVEGGMRSGEFSIEDAHFGRDLILGACLAVLATLLREGTASVPPETVACHVLLSLGVPKAKAKRIASQPLLNRPPIASSVTE